MTQLSAPAPSPSVQRKSSGRFIDFVARPKSSRNHPKTSKPAPKAAPVKITPKTAPAKPAAKAIPSKPVSKTPTPAKPVAKTTTPAKPTTKASAPVKPAAKPTAKPTASPKPTIKISETPEGTPRHRHIAPRGLRMDFARRPANHPLPEVKVKKTVRITVAATPAMRPAPAPKPQPSPHQVQIIRSDETDDLSQIDDTTFIENDDLSRIPSEDISLPPISSEDDDLSLALSGFADADPAPSLTDRHSKEVSALEEELDALDELDEISDDLEAEIADFVDEPKPLFGNSKTPDSSRSPDSPDANKFSLGGRSPFLTSVKVEKRPLSGVAMEEEEIRPLKAEAKNPLKNAYRAKIKQVFKDDNKAVHRETTIVSTPTPHAHNIGLGIAILLTILLGAMIGAVIYLVFFQ